MRLMLIVRGVVSLWFATRFVGGSAGSMGALLAQVADYLVVDGALGLLIAAALYREGLHAKPHLGSLGVVLLIDAAGRMTSGIAANVYPGIPDFPLTAALFVAMMATFTALLGVAEAGVLTEEGISRLGPRHARAQFAMPPVLLSAMASVVFGAALLFTANPPTLRLLFAGYFASNACVMFAMAWTRRSSAPVLRTPA
jgi:hypothetical protein